MYKRADGTLSYFFREDEVEKLADEVGLSIVRSEEEDTEGGEEADGEGGQTDRAAQDRSIEPGLPLDDRAPTILAKSDPSPDDGWDLRPGKTSPVRVLIRRTYNRKEGWEVERRYIQATFAIPRHTEPPETVPVQTERE